MLLLSFVPSSLVFAAAAAGAVLLTARWLLRPRPLPNFPVAPGALPLVGHSLDLIRWMIKHENLEAWYRDQLNKDKHLLETKDGGGPKLLQVMTTWKQPQLLITDPKMIDQVFASPDFDFADADIFRGLIPDAMIAHPTDSLVKAHRKSLAYSHSPAFVSLAGTLFSAHFERVLAKWDTVATKGTFFPVAEQLQSFMTDLVAELSFGESFHQFETDQTHPVAEAMETLVRSLSAGAFVTLQHWIQRQRPSYKAAYMTFDRYVAARIEHARERIREGGEIAEVRCLIDIVMQKEARDGEGSVMSRTELRDEVFLANFASQETSTTAQLWAIKHLSENPRVQLALHQALVKLLPRPTERAPTAAEVAPLATPYLEAVVHEILRVQSIFGYLDRQAVRDTTLTDQLGYSERVPAGTTVALLSFYAGTLGSGLKDGTEFKPERWLDEKTGAFDQTRVWSRPFGAGARSCYGFKTALVFLRLFIAQLSLAYFVLPLPDELRTDQVKHYVSRRPAKNFVGLMRWEDDQAGEMVEGEGEGEGGGKMGAD